MIIMQASVTGDAHRETINLVVRLRIGGTYDSFNELVSGGTVVASHNILFIQHDNTNEYSAVSTQNVIVLLDQTARSSSQTYNLEIAATIADDDGSETSIAGFKSFTGMVIGTR